MILNLSESEMELLRFIVGDFIESEYADGFGEEPSCRMAETIKKRLEVE